MRRASRRESGVSGHEPTKEQCQGAAQKAVEDSRKALEDRGVGWDLLAGKLKEELNAFKTEQFLGKTFGYRVDKRTKKRVRFTTSKVIYSEGLVDWSVRQKARISAHELSGHFPPKETRIAGPGGGPIPLQRLTVEFVRSDGARKKEDG